MSDRGFFKERLLRLTELDPPVRRIVYTTFAAFAALALAIAVRDKIAGPDLATRVLYHFPRNILLIGAVMLSLATAMILAGAAHLRTRWRYPLIGVIFAAIWLTYHAAPKYFTHVAPALYQILRGLPAPFLILMIALTWLGPRIRPLKVFYLSLAGTIGFVGAIAIAASMLGIGQRVGVEYVTATFTVLMLAAAFAVVPAVMVVGFDLAELGSEGVAALLPFLSRFRGGQLLLSLALSAAGLFLTYQIYHSFHGLGVEKWHLLIMAAVLGISAPTIFAILSRGPHSPPRAHSVIGYIPVLCIATCIFASVPINLWLPRIDPAFETYSGAKTFAFRRPSGLKAAFKFAPEFPKNSLLVGYTVSNPADAVYVFSIPVRETYSPNLGDLTHKPALSKIQVVLRDLGSEGWRAAKTHVIGPTDQFSFFVFEHDDSADLGAAANKRYITCGGPDTQVQQVGSMCVGIAGTFSPTLSGADQASPLVAGILGALFIAGAFGLLYWAQHRTRGRARVPWVDFAVWALLLTGARWATWTVLPGDSDPIVGLLVPAAELIALLLLSLSLAALGMALFAGPKVNLIMTQALASTVLVALLLFLYAYAVGGAESQWIRAAIILIALSWELATSGPNLTPAKEHGVFPRSSRLLIFVGYLLLVATCVFVFNDDQKLATGGEVGPFDTEMFVGNAVATFGGALILSRLFRQLAEIWRAGNSRGGGSGSVPPL